LRAIAQNQSKKQVGNRYLYACVGAAPKIMYTLCFWHAVTLQYRLVALTSDNSRHLRTDSSRNI
jgi:hypothetical protein